MMDILARKKKQQKIKFGFSLKKKLLWKSLVHFCGVLKALWQQERDSEKKASISSLPFYASIIVFAQMFCAWIIFYYETSI